jgi:hypothetical protein
VNVNAKLDCTSFGRAIFSKIWKDEHQLQEIENFKQNPPEFLLVTQFSTNSILNPTSPLIGHAIFNRIRIERQAKLNTPSFLLVVPFSTDSIFKTCDSTWI